MKTILTWIQLRTDCDVICLQEVFTKPLEDCLQFEAPKLGWKVLFAPNEPCFGKKYLGFHSTSGLCTLVKNSIEVLGTPDFLTFTERGGVDRFVRKGVLAVPIQIDGIEHTILNTHLQSDLTDIPPLRINYPALRTLQEQELYKYCLRFKNPICCGDFNQDSFFLFERFDYETRVTFPETGEHLDHILVPRNSAKKYNQRQTIYFHSMHLSDHIPIFFSFSFSEST